MAIFQAHLIQLVAPLILFLINYMPVYPRWIELEFMYH